MSSINEVWLAEGKCIKLKKLLREQIHHKSKVKELSKKKQKKYRINQIDTSITSFMNEIGINKYLSKTLGIPYVIKPHYSY